ncbi:NAD(P)/FAD-dependent oxidoreductase [Butyrivibrio sp. MC2013]|uniref:NAD(P)/FAD-dependent oxidoreductase n=1 Tax=Butyrivibrio sp. MC2013 TaxID=1280686 RepID=UPI000418B328|nr:NAD(P)/FAD-dependent oxidoreductase [Butyrivibrio sp. MC2013]
MKKALIIGAGPAGLTAAYELLKQSSQSGEKIDVVVFEESGDFGGIAKTVNYKGNRMDMGGHRLFSKVPEVNAWWSNMLPAQGAPAMDDIILNREVETAIGGPDPEKEDNVMLRRRRVSRILFDGKFFDYPISLKWNTIKTMGFATTMRVGFSYLAAVFHKRPEDNLENLYINNFGRKLYSMFFEYYTENLWGRHPSEIDASWGKQRTKGLSIFGIIKDYLGKLFKVKNRKVNTSLIEEFKYPKYGPGQMWDVTAQKVEELGGTILKHARVKSFHKDEKGLLTSLTYEQDGREMTMEGDYFISSMPIKDLVGGMNDVPAEPARIAEGLPYRDYMTLGVLVPRINLKNETKLTTVSNIVPDCWIYVQDRNVKMGRLQIYNNWSPYLIKDLKNTVWLGLEYFVNEGDEYWNMTEKEFSDLGVSEMVRLGLIDSADCVLDTHMEKVKKAYPAYFDTYDEIDTLIEWLDTIDNLYCVGRNGQHRYNNIDHSMITSFEAVKCIMTGSKDKTAMWKVNTEEGYHETVDEKDGENEVD